MKLFVIAIKDNKAGVFNAPMFVTNVNAAIRDLADMINAPEKREAWQRHPEDHDLWQIHEWDNLTGTFGANADGHDHKHITALGILKA